MIAVKGEQGTPEWHALRSGIPTASNFDRIITPGGKASSQADDYLAELIGEYISGESDDEGYNSYWMQRGTELEPEARLHYEITTGRQVTEAAFCYQNKKRDVGCSPDGLIYRGRKLIKGLEIKCPSGKMHCAYWYKIGIPRKYLAQVQGSMWVCNVDAWDFMSYHPNYEEKIDTAYRDEDFDKALDKCIPEFLERLEEAKAEPRVQDARAARIDAQEAA